MPPKTGFEVSASKKAAQINEVRRRVFTELAAEGLTSEQSILRLHGELTADAPLELGSPVERILTMLYVSGHGALLTKAEAIGFARKLAKAPTNGLEVTLATHGGRGAYRSVGALKDLTKDTSTIIWQPLGVAMFNRDGQSTYDPPYLHVDTLMSNLCAAYEKSMAAAGDDLRLIALNLAFFYSMGIKLIHPFYGAHHRVFDRFLELEYYKRGINLVLPLDRDSNIPKEDPFRNHSALVCHNLLLQNRLGYDIPPEFSLLYQTLLVQSINEAIQGGPAHHLYSVFYSRMALNIFNWLDLPANQKQEGIEFLHDVRKTAEAKVTIVRRGES